MKTSALPLLIDFFQTIFAGLYSLPCVTIEVSVLLSTQSASDLTETSLNANNKVRKKDFFFKGIPLFLFFIYLLIYFWLRWVFVSVQGLSPVAASGGHSSSRCAGLSLLRPLLLQSTGSRRAGSAVVAHGPSRSAACGIFPDQGSNPCPLHWQADSQPLRHEGSPEKKILYL